MKKLTGVIFLAGLCGGMAEIVWVAIYSAMTPTSGMEVARQISVSVFPAMVDSSAAASVGIAVHLLLSLLLAGVFTLAVWLPFSRKLRFVPAMLVAVAALSGVWAINFFVILPVLNPAFVVLMPYAATLFSKVLFGIAMGWSLAYSDGCRLNYCPARGWWQHHRAAHDAIDSTRGRSLFIS